MTGGASRKVALSAGHSNPMQLEELQAEVHCKESGSSSGWCTAIMVQCVQTIMHLL
jgi:hypothetical protein